MKIETLHKNVASRYPDAFDCAVNNELKDILTQGLKRLPPKQRVIIEDHFLGDSKSFRELGREHGCSHECVRKVATKGLDSLKETLHFLGGIFDSPNMPKRTQPAATDTTTRKQTNRLTKEQYAALTRSQRKEKHRQDTHRSYLKHRERKLLENKRRYQENKEYYHWLTKTWIQKHTARHKTYQQQYHKQRKENLADAYVVERLIEGTNLAKQDIPLTLIELKRKQLTLYRSIERKGKS